jgi:3-hydroxybutyryl-CoA dehydrogenase
MPTVNDSDAASRPIGIVGAGTLGWQIAGYLACRGATVRLHDIDPAQLERARHEIEAALPLMAPEGQPRAFEQLRLTLTDDLSAALADVWLVIEAVPERADLKARVFGELDRLAPHDALLATNSSSFKSSALIERVSRPERVLNTHFYNLPWRRSAVEVMSCGQTAPEALDLVMRVLAGYGLRPFLARAESTGFIYNRIWAAIKREALLVVAEGVATPHEVDDIWNVVNGTDTGPFALMDRVGLDVVLDIEEHYAAERDGLPLAPRQLLRDYVDAGRLGVKTGEGFYRHTPE